MSHLPPLASRPQSLSVIATVLLEVRGGIRSSADAAKIKFGLEALPGVTAVHFPDDKVAVCFYPEIVSARCLEETLAAAGIDVLVVTAAEA